MGIGGHRLPKDLNARAQIALWGLSDDALGDIAALLRSDQPISEKTRTKLADAMEGIGDGVHLRLKASPRHKRAKIFLRKLTQLRQGQWADRRAKQVGYAEATRELAEKAGKSEKAAESSIALARKVNEWLDLVLEQEPIGDWNRRYELQIEWLAASMDKREPQTSVSDWVLAAVQLAHVFEREQASALEPSQWFLA